MTNTCDTVRDLGLFSVTIVSNDAPCQNYDKIQTKIYTIYHMPQMTSHHNLMPHFMSQHNHSHLMRFSLKLSFAYNLLEYKNKPYFRNMTHWDDFKMRIISNLKFSS